MAQGSKPGERRGGRQKGTPNKRKAAREEAIAKAGVDPKTFMLNGLAFYQAQIDAEEAKGDDADQGKIAVAYAAGKEFAKDVAPYCHARMATVEHSGRIDSKVEHTSDARDRLAHFVAGQAAADGEAEGTRTTH